MPQNTLKLALFVSPHCTEGQPLTDWAEGVYARVSEYVEVKFPPRKPAEYVPEQLAALDKLAAEVTAECEKKLAAINEQRANLLALTYSPEAA